MASGWVSLRRQKQEQARHSRSSSPLCRISVTNLSARLRSVPPALSFRFHPRTGRGPLVERNSHGLPIGDFLYSSGRKASAPLEEPKPGPKVGETSRQLFEADDHVRIQKRSEPGDEETDLQTLVRPFGLQGFGGSTSYFILFPSSCLHLLACGCMCLLG